MIFVQFSKNFWPPDRRENIPKKSQPLSAAKDLLSCAFSTASEPRESSQDDAADKWANDARHANAIDFFATLGLAGNHTLWAPLLHCGNELRDIGLSRDR